MPERPVRLVGYCACGAMFEATLRRHVRGVPRRADCVDVMGDPKEYAVKFRDLHTTRACRPCTKEEAEAAIAATWHRLHDPEQVSLPLDNP